MICLPIVWSSHRIHSLNSLSIIEKNCCYETKAFFKKWTDSISPRFQSFHKFAIKWEMLKKFLETINLQEGLGKKSGSQRDENIGCPFSGLTDEWQCVTLGEIMSKNKETNVKKNWDITWISIQLKTEKLCYPPHAMQYNLTKFSLII